MDRISDFITRYCIEKEIILETNAQWFKYGIEKRIMTICATIPFLLISMVLTNISFTFSFFVSFSLIRQRTNGFHAKSMLSCIIFSIVFEIVFICLLLPLLNRFVTFVLIALCTVLVFWLAPYEHDNMKLSPAEKNECKKRSRFIISITGFFVILLSFSNQRHFANGITIGMTMATFLLCLGYIYEWRKPKNEKLQRVNETSKTTGLRND